MPSHSLTYHREPLEKADKNFSFPFFDLMLYAAAAIGASVLMIELFPVGNFKIALTAVIVFGTIGLIFTRQMQAIKAQMKLIEKQSEQKSELHFNNLIKDSSDITAIFQTNGKSLFLSSSIRTVLGYSVGASLGTCSYDFVHPDDVEKVRSDYQRAFDDPEYIFRNEFRYKHFNGSWRILEGVGRQFQDENGKPIGVLHNSRDITDRKLAEDQLRAFAARLEQSNRELQDFAYVASHDLQEPLRKVQAFGDRLNRKYADKLGIEGNDYVARMRDAADRMQTLINDLLTFSRITTKAQPFVQLDLTRIVREVISDLEIKVEETGAKIEISDLPAIDADPLQMRQLFQNLIGNALKFSRPEITPHIKIYPLETAPDIHKTQTAGSFTEFAVEDNGIGFEEKYLDRIFTVFQRLHGRAEYEGSGVGLAVCRKIVERHGGKITARSKPNEGAVFIISLPVTQIRGGFLDE